MPSWLNSEIAWAALAPLLVRSAAVLGAAGVATVVMRRATAAARHLVWLSAVVGVLALPVLAAMPGWRLLPRTVIRSGD